MADAKKEPQQITIIEDPHAPDFFASWHHGLAFRHGNIHVTFITDRPSHSETHTTTNMVVTGRLIMPLAGARDLAMKLREFLDRVEKGSPVPDQGAPTLQ